MCSVCQATQQIIAVLRVAHSILAPHHACAYRPHIHAYLLPSSSLGPHSRRPNLASAVLHVTTCQACGSGALRRPAFSLLECSVPPWRPFYLGQLEPWSARTHHLPLRRLAPVSRSVGLSPTLSLPFSLAFPCSFSPVAPLCSFPTVLYPLSLSLCFSLPPFRAQKKGSGLFGASLSPPGFEPSYTGQKRCGVSTEPRRRVVCTMAPWHHALHSSSPFCHPMSCVSSFAWGCVQQCVEEYPSPGTGSACLKSVLWNNRKRSARPASHTCMQSPVLLTEEGTALCPSAVRQWRIASHWNGCHLPALLGRHWTCMFARAWVFRVQLIWTITE